MGMSVDGLVTGMSTTDTVNQLMKIEAIPQQALKTKVGIQNKAVAAYQSVNSRLSSLVSAAKALGGADSWGAIKATSSSDAALVTAKPGAATGSLSFRVMNLAATHVMTYSAGSVAATTDNAMSGTTLGVKLTDGSVKAVDLTGDTSLQAVVNAINDEPDALYKAAAVKIADGRYTLQLTAKDGGEAGVFTDADADLPTGLSLGAATITVQGDDARLQIGSGPGAYQVESETNTFTDLLPGITITAVKAQAPTDPLVAVNLTADAEGIAAKVQALIDNANVVLSEIASQSKTKSGDVPAGPLVGDSSLRKLSQDILSAVASGAGGAEAADGEALNTFHAVGVSLDRSGKLTFDKQKFLDAYQADPAKTQLYFDAYADRGGHADAVAGKFQPGWDTAQGLGRKLEAIALIASEGVIVPGDPANKPKQGLLQNLIQRRNSFISDLNDQVTAWDRRLELRKTALHRQFSGLEVAMGKMQQQSSWLAGQLASLPTYS